MVTDLLIKVICDEFDISKEYMTSKRRYFDCKFARFFFFFYAKKLTNLTWKKIGSLMDLDHSTAMHGVAKMKTLLFIAQDKELIEINRKLENTINSIIYVSKEKILRWEKIEELKKQIKILEYEGTIEG